MPEFEGAEGFPSGADDLPQVALGAWEQLLFVALDPMFPLADLVGDVRSRCDWLPWSRCALDAERSRDYAVRANWALYVDNYLEGLHIPHVHKGLAAALDYPGYRTELFRWSSLQVAMARAGQDAFEPPASSPDHGSRIAAYYFWLFPNTMLNVYPWGVSVNVVRPVAVDRAEISFLTFVWDRSRLDRGAGADLEAVEREDEAVVESVQRGMRSRLYDRGRYSPAHEAGVHHFHRLLVQSLAGRR
jgi:choline monooxygenase